MITNKVFALTASALMILALFPVINHLESVPKEGEESDSFVERYPHANNENPNVLNDKLARQIVEDDGAPMHTSLQGSQIDAANVFVVDGVIMIDQSLRFYYEYYLSLQGEVSEDKIGLLLVKDAHKRYEPLAAQYVIDLFHRYTDYLHEANTLISSEQKKETLSVLQKQRLADNLQEQFFTAVEKTVLFDDTFLTVYDNENSMQGAYDNYKKMQSYLPDANLEVLRVENFGVEVASRFTVLDMKRAQWQQRLHAYQCERNVIDGSEGLHAMDKSQGIQSLQQRLFTHLEIRRLKVLEKHQLMNPVTECS